MSKSPSSETTSETLSVSDESIATSVANSSASVVRLALVVDIMERYLKAVFPIEFQTERRQTIEETVEGRTQGTSTMASGERCARIGSQARSASKNFGCVQVCKCFLVVLPYAMP